MIKIFSSPNTLLLCIIVKESLTFHNQLPPIHSTNSVTYPFGEIHNMETKTKSRSRSRSIFRRNKNENNDTVQQLRKLTKDNTKSILNNANNVKKSGGGWRKKERRNKKLKEVEKDVELNFAKMFYQYHQNKYHSRHQDSSRYTASQSNSESDLFSLSKMTTSTNSSSVSSLTTPVELNTAVSFFINKLSCCTAKNTDRR